MQQVRRYALAVSLALLLAGAGGSVVADRLDQQDGVFAFALWGDMPYSSLQVTQIPNLIADVNRAHVAFTVFDGDIKSGSSLCTDDVYQAAIDRFNTFERPMIYVPGDNEWTDCHRTNNGGFNNLERLDFVRQTMFASLDSFGQHRMTPEHQGVLGAPYVENTRWRFGGVYFLGLNIPGSNNNKVSSDAECTSKSVRTLADCAADNVEYAARDAANVQYLHDTFDLARTSGARGVVIVIQADMGFDLPETDVNERNDPAVDGYTNFLGALVSETKGFDGQVLLVHGDTHFFKLDKPLLDQADLIPNFTRLETFGSPNVHWVQVTVDPRVRQLFIVEPRMVAGN